MRNFDLIRKYIFDDIFDFYVDVGLKNEKDRVLQQKGLAKRKFFYFFAKFFLDSFNLLNKIKLKNNKKNTQGIYFYADPLNYSEIVFELSKKYNLFFNNPLRVEKRVRFNSNTYYFPFVKQARALTNGFLNNNDLEIIESLDQIKSVLREIQPKLIVLNDAALPINRAIIQISKELGIYTIEIQHAIYQYEDKLFPGEGADFVYVWGDFFKNMYKHQNIRDNNSVKILGYPFKSNLDNKLMSEKKLTLYYLAQGFQYEDIKNVDRLLENALYLKKLSDDLNITFKCKLHPNSPKILLDKVLPFIECNPIKQTMENAISDGDLFISFNSTALIEAAFQGKKCIQLMNLPVTCDNFEELGICETFLNLEDLSSHLKNIFKIDRNKILSREYLVKDGYIKTFECGPGKRFVNLIQETVMNK